MSFKRLETIADFIRNGLNAKIECGRCNRVVIVPAARIRDYCFKRSIPIRLETVEPHLRCSCGHRGAKLEPAAMDVR